MSRVLVVEDDQFLRNAYKNVLSKEEYDVKMAESGAAALDIIKEWKPDLIMLDLFMPGVDGLEFLRRYEPKKHKEVKIIILSNNAAQEKIDEAMELGASDYRIKANISPKEMINLVEKTVPNKQKKTHA